MKSSNGGQKKKTVLCCIAVLLLRCLHDILQKGSCPDIRLTGKCYQMKSTAFVEISSKYVLPVCIKMLMS